MRALTAVRRRRGAASGFSLIEVLVALVIFLAVLAIMFSFFIQASQHAATEESALEAQQRARIALDSIERTVRQAGFGIQRDDSTDAGSWQHELIHAGAYTIAFNADLDESLGPGEGIGALDTTQTIVIPGADGASYSYRGEGLTAGDTEGAETHVFTIDADDDSEFTLADRTQVDGSVYNPAADTQVPLDFAVFHRTYGRRLVPTETLDSGLQGLGAHLFTNAVDDDETRYPADGSSPSPLFVYILSEDLNADGILADGECVVAPCPPDDVRTPTLYIWGDGGADGDDFDGALDDEEREALRTLPVGDGGWAANPLVDGSGDYFATTLTNAVAAGPDNVSITVDDASLFLAGQYIRIGPDDAEDTDATVETIVIEDVNTGSNTIYLQAPIAVGHASGQEVRVLPRTLLRMVRAVEIHYDAVTPRIETRTPGRSGRKGTKGLDYRVRELVKKVELLNLTTAALPDPTPPEASEYACPLTVAGQCSDASVLTSMTIYLPQTTPVPVQFRVANGDDNGVGNASLTFSNSNVSAGAPAGETATTDGFGNASASYVPAGIVGNDTLTAVGQCNDGSGLVDTDPAEVSIVLASMTINPNAACSNTILASGGSPVSIPFTVTLTSAGGPLANEEVTLGLAFATDVSDPEYPPSYADVQGELIVDGVSQGTTDLMDGTFTPVTATTNGSGVIAGEVKLLLDTARAGVRIFLVATKSGNDCDTIGTTATYPFTFNRLELISVPTPGCTSTARCVIAAGAAAPKMKAVLKRNNIPISGATITITGTKVSGPAASTVRLVPPTGVTSVAGEFQFEVGHNNDAGVSVGNPLLIDVSASTTGANVGCNSGTINSLQPAGGYQFNGSAVSDCNPDIIQAYLTKNAGVRNYCLKVKNLGACPIKLLGIQQWVYTTAPPGATLDAAKTLKKMTGGTIIPAGGAVNCTVGAGNVTLFDTPCNTPGGTMLPNGNPWTFLTYLDKCAIPSMTAPQDGYWVLPFIDWNNTTLVAGRRYDIKITYECFGSCSGTPIQTKTVTLVVPA